MVRTKADYRGGSQVQNTAAKNSSSFISVQKLKKKKKIVAFVQNLAK